MAFESKKVSPEKESKSSTETKNLPIKLVTSRNERFKNAFATLQ
jgi:hypothetical protein